MYLGQICLSERCSFFLIYKCYVRSIKIDFFREYATIPIIIIIIIIIIITVTTKEGK